MCVTIEDFINQLNSNNDCIIGIPLVHEPDFKNWFKEKCEIFETNEITEPEFNSSNFRKILGQCYWNAQINFFLDQSYKYYEGLVYKKTEYHFNNHAFNVQNISRTNHVKDFTYNNFQEVEDNELNQIIYCGVRISKDVLDYLVDSTFEGDHNNINNLIPLIVAQFYYDTNNNDFFELQIFI